MADWKLAAIRSALLLIAFCIGESSTDSTGLIILPWSDGVCSTQTYVIAYQSQKTSKMATTYYYVKCGWWWKKRCQRKRSYRKYYYATRIRFRLVTKYHCCPGWQRIGHSCSKIPTTAAFATTTAPPSFFVPSSRHESLLLANPATALAATTAPPYVFVPSISRANSASRKPLRRETQPPKALSSGKEYGFVRKNMMKYFSGSERVAEVLLPKINDDVLSVVSKNKTFKSLSKPSKTFYGALKDIEQGIVQASTARGPQVRYSEKKVKSLKSTIELAVDKRMYRFARQRLGGALFIIGNHNSRRRSKRSPSASPDPDPSDFIADLKSSLGDEKFEKFMAVRGGKTLMFAIDTTGSMSGEIETAKRIAVEIANYPREVPVTYILSPFNDPNDEEVTYAEDAATFVESINKLKANGGGDCPELTITGILNALEEGPEDESPMYVFTDASAKDATPSNMNDVKMMATGAIGTPKTTINFFTTGLCGDSVVDHPFREIAEATTGQVLRLGGTGELNLLKKFVGRGLDESSILASGSSTGSSRRRKRSAEGSRYSIKADDSVRTLLISVTTDNSGQGPLIVLRDPRGVNVTSGKVSMSKVSIYEIENPAVGTWTLVIPATSGQHTYFASSVGNSTIDFTYFFLLINTRKPFEEPLTDPLKGKRMKVVLTLTGAENIRNGTAALELITRNGDHIRDIPLTSSGDGEERYTATLIPPSQPFKLKVKGTTKGGHPFERISRNVEQPKSIQLRVLYSSDEFTLKRGEVSSVTFRLYNAANVNKRVKNEVRDKLGFSAIPKRNVRTLRRKRQSFFRVQFTTPSSASVGAKDILYISVYVNDDEEVVSLPVQLLVTA